MARLTHATDVINVRVGIAINYSVFNSSLERIFVTPGAAVALGIVIN